MILQIFLSDGLGKSEPLVLNAHQVLVSMDDGTPIMAAAAYGPNQAVAIGSVYHDEDEFHTMLRNLGIRMTTVVKRLAREQPPPGAKLLVRPDSARKDS